ncbi:MAG TPA: carboxypeptidase regulatory-like domain-containing protein, partial [Pilimelia sp.]|nr:carboxypeptidase regulatory-like domain-containing protein [Pilimelia sp.]
MAGHGWLDRKAVDVHTHRRAWMLRVGVTAALVAGATAGLAAPAYADDPEVRIITLSNNTLTSGQQANLQYSVKNTNREATEFTIRVETSDGLQCDGECTFPDRPLEPDETATFNARLISPNLRPGEERDARVQVIAQSRANSQDRESAEQDITLRGPQQAPTVERVAGRITDADTGDGVPNANVAMIDSAGKTWQEEADDNGRFSFTSSAAKPIAPGRVTIAVQADGFSDQRTSFSVGAGPGRTNVRLRLAATAAPSASASAPPTTPPTLPPTVAPETTAGALGSTPVNDEDSSLPWVFILGGLLVALGVGAIVLLLVRRKQDKELADEDAEVGAAGAAAVPASRGAFHGAPGDPTRVANRAGMGADATMVGRPNLADAPTMLQSPIRDEYADPYGLPAVPPQAPGYGGAPTQPAWAGAGGYGDATQVGRGPVSGPGYGAPTSGAPAGGYGPPTSGAPGGAYGPP